jgi:hypothetical protein
MKRILTAITSTAVAAIALGASLPLAADVTIRGPYAHHPHQTPPEQLQMRKQSPLQRLERNRVNLGRHPTSHTRTIRSSQILALSLDGRGSIEILKTNKINSDSNRQYRYHRSRKPGASVT